MSAGYSDTTHGRFIEHMDLARKWGQRNGQRGTDAQVLRIMRRWDAELLRAMLAAAEAASTAPGEELVAVVRDLANVYTLDTDQVAVIGLVYRAKKALAAVEGQQAVQP